MPNDQISAEEKEIYDRQIRIWGHSVQSRLKNAHVAVVGINGLSAEIVKDLVLSGIGELTLADFCKPSHRELDSNFLFQNELSTSAPIASQVADYVRSLNPFVRVHHRDMEDIDNMNTVLTTPSPVQLVVFCRPLEFPQAFRRILQECAEHEPAVPLITAGLAGLRGFAILDLIQYKLATDETAAVSYPCSQSVLDIKEVDTKPRAHLKVPILQSAIDILNEKADLHDNVLAGQVGLHSAPSCSIFGSMLAQTIIQYIGEDTNGSKPANGANILLFNEDVVSAERHPKY
ncbi:ThiF family [Carpediemonas membranifera]|uniref:ThiF family n=1 Tax=Carpediemonas membranifera TaxID=201153 RepID=A0A8J6E1P4_9EUKA|nr:ThiF family [Carpediemonas membranifera]|eukprot:KAG9390892.1 ThiF family [Carpediemonas membranifera]